MAVVAGTGVPTAGALPQGKPWWETLGETLASPEVAKSIGQFGAAVAPPGTIGERLGTAGAKMAEETAMKESIADIIEGKPLDRSRLGALSETSMSGVLSLRQQERLFASEKEARAGEAQERVARMLEAKTKSMSEILKFPWRSPQDMQAAVSKLDEDFSKVLGGTAAPAAPAAPAGKAPAPALMTQEEVAAAESGRKIKETKAVAEAQMGMQQQQWQQQFKESQAEFDRRLRAQYGDEGSQLLTRASESVQRIFSGTQISPEAAWGAFIGIMEHNKPGSSKLLGDLTGKMSTRKQAETQPVTGATVVGEALGEGVPTNEDLGLPGFYGLP